MFFGQAETWIESVKGKQPFFAYITPNAAHAPLDVPDEYFRHYEGKVPDNLAKFYGMIENIDENFGRLLARLKAWGLEDNTLVIFLTDNGTATGARHLQRRHAWIEEFAVPGRNPSAGNVALARGISGRSRLQHVDRAHRYSPDACGNRRRSIKRRPKAAS